MREMAPEEWRTFLLAGPRTAKLATVREDGSPHVAPVWFDLDGDQIVFTTGRESVKGRAIQRDGRVALCVDDETPPFAFVAIEGRARVSAEPNELRRWAARIGGRYLGAARAEAMGGRYGASSEVLVRVTPTRVVARRDVVA
jgi:PPOX class probable F420-dependent enzyme